MPHVPYRGSGPALKDMIGGRMDVMFDNPPSALPHIQSGALKAFAVTGGVRSGAVPELPTVPEAAALPGFEASSCRRAAAERRIRAAAVKNLGALSGHTPQTMSTPAFSHRSSISTKGALRMRRLT